MTGFLRQIASGRISLSPAGIDGLRQAFDLALARAFARVVRHTMEARQGVTRRRHERESLAMHSTGVLAGVHASVTFR